MTRDAGIFAASVVYSEGRGWEATLLTRQRGEWKPAVTPWTHSVLGVVMEAERRAKWITRGERKAQRVAAR